MASFESDENEGRERINRKHNGTFHSHWPGSNENLLIKNEKKKKKKKKKATARENLLSEISIDGVWCAM